MDAIMRPSFRERKEDGIMFETLKSCDATGESNLKVTCFLRSYARHIQDRGIFCRRLISLDHVKSHKHVK
jgi:hypothetical protein